MFTIQEMESQIGKRVRYLGSSDPDPDLEVGQEGTVWRFKEDRFRLVVSWDTGLTIFLIPGYDSWEVIEIEEEQPMETVPKDVERVLPDLSEDMKANRYNAILALLLKLDNEAIDTILDVCQQVNDGLAERFAKAASGWFPGDQPIDVPLSPHEFAIFKLGSVLIPVLAMAVAGPGEVDGDFYPWQPLAPAYLDEEALRLAMGGKSGESKVFMNDRYQVFMREYGALSEGDDSRVVHLSIKQRDKGSLHDWRDLQRIKNDLLGPEAEALEIYPAESRLVDTSNQYHLWAFRLPDGSYWKAGFGLNAGRLVSNVAGTGGRQRPFCPQDLPAELMEHTVPLDPNGQVDIRAVIRGLDQEGEANEAVGK